MSAALLSNRNCNHFTEHFIKILTNKELPSYVNRIMKVATKVRVCLPGMFTNDLRDQQAPPEYENHKYAVPQPRDSPTGAVAPTTAAQAAAAAGINVAAMNAGAPMNRDLINDAVAARDRENAQKNDEIATSPLANDVPATR